MMIANLAVSSLILRLSALLRDDIPVVCKYHMLNNVRFGAGQCHAVLGWHVT